MNAPLAAALGVALLCGAIVAGHHGGWLVVPGLNGWEASTEDVRVRLAGGRAPLDERIVIVALDERTRREMPEVFQTRRGLARVIDAVAAGRPLVAGLDLFFAQPEVNLPAAVVAQVREAASALEAEAATADSSGAALSAAARAALGALAAVIDETRGDEVLAASVARAGPLHLGFLLHLGEAGAPAGTAEPPGLAPARLGEVAVGSRAPARHPPRAHHATVSLAPIASAAAGAGFVNVTPDEDGVLRRVPLVIEHGGRYYTALGVSLALAALGEPRGGAPAGAGYATGSDRLHLAGREVPVDRRGRASLSYLGPSGTFPVVSAADLLAGKADGALAGKIVLVGYTDVARDRVVQPLDRAYAGVEVHATLVHNLLHGELLVRTEPRTAVLLVLALGGLIALLQLRRIRQRSAWLPAAGALAAGVAYLVLAGWLLASRGVIIPLVAPLLAAALVTATALVVALATEGREKARLRAAFAHYVAPGVVDRIVADPSRVRLGGERRELTVMFCDIRGFSGAAENLEPEVLSEYLNEYFTPMTRIVLEAGGMLDKYIGDALMAVYGAPLEVSDHAERACASALAMLQALGPLNTSFTSRGLPSIGIGVGLSTGPMSVGNMGSQARFDYTVLGDAVNLGARLEALTREYRVDILVAEATARAAEAGFVFRELDTVRVRGRSGVGVIYQLVGARGAAPLGAEDLARWDEALAHYRSRRWDDADAALERFSAAIPQDGPAEVLRARIAALRAQPPAGDWDGVFEQRTK